MKLGHLTVSLMQVGNCQNTLTSEASAPLWSSTLIKTHPIVPLPSSCVSHLPDTSGQDKEPLIVVDTGPPILRFKSSSPRLGREGSFAVLKRIEDEQTLLVAGMVNIASGLGDGGKAVVIKDEPREEQTEEATGHDAADEAKVSTLMPRGASGAALFAS